MSKKEDEEFIQKSFININGEKVYYKKKEKK
jgi:hypothetical protein